MSTDKILKRTEQLLVEISSKPVTDLNECTEFDFCPVALEKRAKERAKKFEELKQCFKQYQPAF